MRIGFSFGGGHRNGRDGRFYIGFKLGPLGSAIVGAIIAAIGLFLSAYFLFWSFVAGEILILPLVVTVVFLLIGIYCFFSNIKKISKDNKN